jgi:hypothetical protein
MAASQVSAIISRFKRGQPSCEATFALQLLNDFGAELGYRLELRKLVYTVNLIANQREYILPSYVQMVTEAYYVNSGALGDEYALYAISTDKLAEWRVGWRASTPYGGPWQYYLDNTSADTSTEPATASTSAPGTATVVGFEPLPAQTTSAGYPCVNLYATTQIPYGMNDYIPDNFPGDDVWIDGMEKLFAKSKNPAMFGARQQISDQSVQSVAAKLKGPTLQDRTNLLAGWYYPRRRR